MDWVRFIKKNISAKRIFSQLSCCIFILADFFFLLPDLYHLRLFCSKVSLKARFRRKNYKSSTFTSDFVKCVCDFLGSDLVLSEPLPLTVSSDTSGVSAPSHEIATAVSPHVGSEVGNTLDCI